MVIDRRIGEYDKTMSLEERMLQRFTREKQRTKKATFDLEAENDEELTHFGRSLELESKPFISDDDISVTDIADSGWRSEKKFVTQEQEFDSRHMIEGDAAEHEPEQRRSRAAIMKEVIANSKSAKYERQQEKEEDEELRHELDKELPSVLAAWNASRSARPMQPGNSTGANIDNEVNGVDGISGSRNGQYATEKAYDARIRELILDKRAKPSDRSKTEAEKKAEEQHRRLTSENEKLRRMRGDDSKTISSDAEDDHVAGIPENTDGNNEAAEFGFTDKKGRREDLAVEDEDDFIVDSDLIADGSDLDVDLSSGHSSSFEDDQLGNKEEMDRSDRKGSVKTNYEFFDDTFDTYAEDTNNVMNIRIESYPNTHNDFLLMLQNSDDPQTPYIIQRIRALHNKGSFPDSKEKQANFASILIDHIHYLSSRVSDKILPVIGATIRHVHSMARNHPEPVADAFRGQLQRMHESKQLDSGDLMLLTAISSIYPTSDHFHQIVTPAMTIMANWLEMNYPRNEKVAVSGVYIGTLCLKYQSLAKRYIPELLRFTLFALKTKPSADIRKMYGEMLVDMAGLWAAKPAFPEIFGPELLNILSELEMEGPLIKIRQYLTCAYMNRRPLELHHHRPIPIKSAIPKFEEYYNPEKHYDPDRDRADSKKLRADYKRERKGALRELRKDANFIAREKLRQKRETDAAYEQKYKRLVAEIQGEEGKEKNAYERVKRVRKVRK